MVTCYGLAADTCWAVQSQSLESPQQPEIAFENENQIISPPCSKLSSGLLSHLKQNSDFLSQLNRFCIQDIAYKTCSCLQGIPSFLPSKGLCISCSLCLKSSSSRSLLDFLFISCKYLFPDNLLQRPSSCFFFLFHHFLPSSVLTC